MSLSNKPLQKLAQDEVSLAERRRTALSELNEEIKSQLDGIGKSRIVRALINDAKSSRQDVDTR